MKIHAEYLGFSICIVGGHVEAVRPIHYDPWNVLPGHEEPAELAALPYHERLKASTLDGMERLIDRRQTG